MTEHTRVGLKWSYYDDDVLAAWVAEMDFGLAPSVADALHSAVDNGLTGYEYPDLSGATAQAATRFWRQRLDWEVDPEWVFPVPDVIEGIRRAIVHLTRPGSPVVLHTPVYFPFFSMVERAGRELIEVPSTRGEDGRYRLDLSGIDRALADGAGSIVLCNPWNPTGRVFTADELGELLAVARRHDARVIVDEVHSPITFPDTTHVPISKLDPVLSITVASASKAWNLPGLKCAQVVLTNEKDRSAWSAYFTPEKVGVGTFGLIANTAAYHSGVSWFDGVLTTLEGNRARLGELLAENLPAVGYRPPEGTYLAWLDLSSYELEDPAAFLLQEARVAVTGGGQFRGDGAAMVRFNFATAPDLLPEMVERIARALKPLYQVRSI
ncbi:MAG TPA: aminotransferase class I/II-fold pyridoxal phosphate-dependent enzyme [Acidimicrobiia bacterium]|nr:aminotransferase class I/II-fold pyridoxal phosphate-dependent enzyme [Acidimicrobiia bacterium]